MIFKLYMSKLHKDIPFLWQRLRQGRIHYTDPTWFKPRCVGEDLLNRFMKFLQMNIKLDRTYTNHSIRATVITMLDSKGFEVHHIMALSSHKNESTTKEYSVKCPESKRKAMFQTLTNVMQPRFKKLSPNPHQHWRYQFHLIQAMTTIMMTKLLILTNTNRQQNQTTSLTLLT